MQDTNFHNPEDASKAIMLKSFLKSRSPNRDSGSKFFQDNKIRSCSYVKESEGALKAVPFYDKRNNTIYPTKSTVTRSWNSTVHSNKTGLHAGMGSLKPLVTYHPNQPRNLLGIQDFRPPYPNTSQIQIGTRAEKDGKHYLTNYGNSFITSSRKVPTSHPGIEAFRNKWTRSRIAK